MKESLKEALTRKHFQMVADTLKSIEDPKKRSELAQHHAQIFAKSNPRFDHKRFMDAAGVKLSEMEEIEIEPDLSGLELEEGYSLRRTSKETERLEPNDEDDYDEGPTKVRTTHYDIVHNKSKQVVGSARHKWNNYFGPGDLHGTLKGKNFQHKVDKDPQSDFNKFAKWPSTKKKGYAVESLAYEGEGTYTVHHGTTGEKVHTGMSKHGAMEAAIKLHAKTGVKPKVYHRAISGYGGRSYGKPKQEIAIEGVENMAHEMDEAAKWRTNPKAHTQELPGNDDDSESYDYYHDNPKSTGIKTPATHQKPDTLNKGPFRRSATPMDKGPRAGKITKQDQSRVKSDISRRLGTHTKPNLPESERIAYKAAFRDALMEAKKHAIGSTVLVGTRKGYVVSTGGDSVDVMDHESGKIESHPHSKVVKHSKAAVKRAREHAHVMNATNPNSETYMSSSYEHDFDYDFFSEGALSVRTHEPTKQDNIRNAVAYLRLKHSYYLKKKDSHNAGMTKTDLDKWENMLDQHVKKFGKLAAPKVRTEEAEESVIEEGGSLAHKIKTVMRKVDPTIKDRISIYKATPKAIQATVDAHPGSASHPNAGYSPAAASRHLNQAHRYQRLANGEKPFQKKNNDAEMNTMRGHALGDKASDKVAKSNERVMMATSKVRKVTKEAYEPKAAVQGSFSAPNSEYDTNPGYNVLGSEKIHGRIVKYVRMGSFFAPVMVTVDGEPFETLEGEVVKFAGQNAARDEMMAKLNPALQAAFDAAQSGKGGQNENEVEDSDDVIKPEAPVQESTNPEEWDDSLVEEITIVEGWGLDHSKLSPEESDHVKKHAIPQKTVTKTIGLAGLDGKQVKTVSREFKKNSAHVVLPYKTDEHRKMADGIAKKLGLKKYFRGPREKRPDGTAKASTKKAVAHSVALY